MVKTKVKWAAGDGREPCQKLWGPQRSQGDRLWLESHQGPGSSQAQEAENGLRAGQNLSPEGSLHFSEQSHLEQKGPSF